MSKRLSQARAISTIISHGHFSTLSLALAPHQPVRAPIAKGVRVHNMQGPNVMSGPVHAGRVRQLAIPTPGLTPPAKCLSREHVSSMCNVRDV